MKKYASHLLIVVLSYCFYLVTLAPTIIGGDSAAFCVQVQRFRLHFGRASDHPLYIVLGKLFAFLPFELAYSLNLMSACFAALTVLLVLLILKHLTGSVAAAMFGACALMVSHAFWQHAVIAEVYTFNAFFLALLVYIALTKRIHRLFPVLFPSAFALGLLNHLILVITLPAFLWYIWATAEARWKIQMLQAAGLLVSLSAALLIGLYLVQNQAMTALFTSIVKGPPPITVYLRLPKGELFLKEVLFYAVYLLYQYPFFGVIIGVIGMFQCLKTERSVAILLMLIMLLNGLFFMKTTGWGSLGGTKYTFYISDYTIFAIFVGCGFVTVFDQLRRVVGKWKLNIQSHTGQQGLAVAIVAANIIFTVSLYTLMPDIVSFLNIDLLHARTLPYRDNNTFFLNPNKRAYDGNRVFGEEILERSEKDAVVFADFTIYTILQYLIHIEGIRPDITLVMCDENTRIRDRLDTLKREKPDLHVYIADNNSYYNLKGLEEQYAIQPYASFFEITTQ